MKGSGHGRLEGQRTASALRLFAPLIDVYVSSSPSASDSIVLVGFQSPRTAGAKRQAVRPGSRRDHQSRCKTSNPKINLTRREEVVSRNTKKSGHLSSGRKFRSSDKERHEKPIDTGSVKFATAGVTELVLEDETRSLELNEIGAGGGRAIRTQVASGCGV